MRVGISAWLLPPKCFGTGYFTLNHIRALEKMGVEPFVIGDIGKRNLKGVNINPNESTSRLKRLSKFIINYPLSLMELEKNADVYHNNIPLPSSKKIPTVSVVHSLISQIWGGKKLSWLDSFPLKNSDRVVSVSPITAEVLKEKFGDDNVKIIPPGIWLNEFSPKAKENFVLYSGRFSKDKNTKKLITASKNFNAPLKVTGQGTISETKYGMRLPNEIENFGYVSRQKLSELMGSAKVFILPSKFETFGMVGLEAMASGTPLVISKEAGLSRYLKHKKDAIIIEPTVEGISEGVNQVLDNPALWTKLSKNGLKKVKEFSWDKIILEYISLYHEMLDQK
ncbi:MAG: glycosyltransferase family 4 protein [Candidatus Altiarchaeota archaeon]|nr:glycosyltransferase family 4 protein [Candidatus Altiarchaeota archaeon]